MNLFETITKDEFRERLTENIKTLCKNTMEQATDDQVYEALAFTIRDVVVDKWMATDDTYEKNDAKKVYYLSMEFLMGRFLGNAIINLCIDSDIEDILEDFGINLNSVEEAERDPGLGNGGLGRLAACFLDSLATLELPGMGCGIRYHYGIFKQKIENGEQVEVPDNWLVNGDVWGIKNKELSVEVKFGGRVSSSVTKDGRVKFFTENTYSVMAVPYDYPIVGYKNNVINTLRLWDAQAINRFDLKLFSEGKYDKAKEEAVLAQSLSEVLYPADEFMAGKELRLKQQYFFVSATVQTVIADFVKKHSDFNLLPEKVVFQLNDTHPTLAVAEIMRVLVDVYELEWDKAWEITRLTCAYTNHTIMSEALEKWPIELFSNLLPRIFMIVEEINKRFCGHLIEKYGDNPDKIRKMAIIADGQVRMAHLAIIGSFSVNGVAELHTKILKEQELKDFYEIYPEKFNNKTNGITQRRWLAFSNPKLSSLVTQSIGDGWIKDLSQIKKLESFAEDPSFRQKFMDVKHENKILLANHIKSVSGVSVDPSSIFDIQVKRLHEYKRQLLNVLHILDLYNQIKLNPNIEMVPQTFIFGAKAAASYSRAKLIIKLINYVAALVNNDPVVSKYIKVVFMENYRVSLAEKLIPACDLSEQISTASKEASGTGNMKFMLNGGLTIGTLDGANVEILEEVGKQNIFIFGMTSKEVIETTQRGDYSPWDIYNMNPDIRAVLTSLINGTLTGTSQDNNVFREIYESLLNGYNGGKADEYYVLKDFASYKEAQAKANAYYKNKDAWAKSAIINVANSGKFSSDRTISQYAEEIWNLKPNHVTMM